jgi:hypothetical protein
MLAMRLGSTRALEDAVGDGNANEDSLTAPRARARAIRAGVTFDAARALALALPGVVEGTSYGTAAFKAGGKLLARLREDGETLVVRVDPEARDLLMRSEPETFFITDHYAGHPWVLVRLPRVERAALEALLEEGWRLVAPARDRAGGATKGPALGDPAKTSTKSPAKKPAKRSAAEKPAEKPATTPAGPLPRLRAICLGLPEATERVNHGAPSFAVRGKTFVMFLDNHHGDGRVALWCKAPPGAQEALVASDPRRFFVPPYVGPRGWLGARLDLDPDWNAIEACVEEAHRMVAPKRAPGTTRKRGA